MWKVTVTPTPDEVQFWASGRMIATDTTAPFETPLDLAPGDYKLGLLSSKDGAPSARPPSPVTEPGSSRASRSCRLPLHLHPHPHLHTTPAPTSPGGSGRTTGTAARAPSLRNRFAEWTSRSPTLPLSRCSGGGSSDNVGVAGYGVYRDGRSEGTSSDTRYTFASLACGTGYMVGVDVFDLGRESLFSENNDRLHLRVSRRTPPSLPYGVKLAAATETSVMLLWQPSTDNLGVVGYGLYAGGLRVGSTSEAAATVSGLSCGRSYEVGIDAVDAAGNRSGRTSAYFSTSPCPPDRIAPTQPNNLGVGAATTTSVSLAWAPATDNTGVSAYGLYRGSTRVGTTSQTTTVLGSLSCGTTYQLGVDAVDAAGTVRRSPRCPRPRSRARQHHRPVAGRAASRPATSSSGARPGR